VLAQRVIQNNAFTGKDTAVAEEEVGVAEQVGKALREVLGYEPSADEDLTGAIDSMQKLELLVLLEEYLAIPFEDEALSADWWGTLSGIVAYAESARPQVSSS